MKRIVQYLVSQQHQGQCKSLCRSQGHLVFGLRSRNFTKMPSAAEENQRQEGRTGGYQSILGSVNNMVPDVIVDLRSDTVTKPGPGMREAIANAVVGDDVFDEDPTTKAFEGRVAQLFGKEAALFVTSGTQGNLIAALVHCNARGSEMICGDNSHMFKYEQGNVSQFGGIHSCQLPNLPNGTFSLESLKAHIRSEDIHDPITKLVCVENTHNRCGGRVLPLQWLDDLSQLCRSHGIPIHMDGARVFNASQESGIPVSRICRDMSSVSMCLSKGLGAPAGSVLIGSLPFIAQARRMRKALGGGIRQNGILSAAGLYCLDNMVGRLGEDHANAKLLAQLVNDGGAGKVSVDLESLDTNIVILKFTGNVDEFLKRMWTVEDTDEERRELGGSSVVVKCFPWSESAVRLVVHCDITTDMVKAAAKKICYVGKIMSK